MGRSDVYDVAIIGGGIVGLATAMTLVSKYKLSIVILEAEPRVAEHQTGHNSGVIHSGLYYKPGSLKAENCVRGRSMLLDFCREHGVEYDQCGKIVVATRESELKALDTLEKRGIENGLMGIQKITKEQIQEFEPHCHGVAGLHIPETGIVNYKRVAEKYAEVIEKEGGELCLNQALKAVEKSGQEWILQTDSQTLRSKALINCGGLQCDRIAKWCGLSLDIQIVPFRGEYYEIIKEKEHLVRNLIYPVPDARFPFLGVHFTRMVDGGIEAGPNAVLAFKREGYHFSDISMRDIVEYLGFEGFWKMVAKYWYTGFGEMYRSISKAAFVKALQGLIPELKMEDVYRAGSGVRAQALDKQGRLIDDFRLIEKENMIHVLNAPSPAATSSLSIGLTISELAEKNFGLKKKK